MYTENELYISSFKDEIAQTYAKEQGKWLVGNVSGGAWPETPYLVIYENQKILILPPTNTYYPSLALNLCQSLYRDIKEAKKFLMRFISALSWVNNSGINIVSWADYKRFVTISDHMRHARKGNISEVVYQPHFRLTYLPSPQSEHARLALALYREGMFLNHTGYAFLSLYKIINLRFKKGGEQKEWIKKNIPKIQDQAVKKRIKDIKGNSIPEKYLYHSCRCAVAHAYIDDTVYNPDNLGDDLRLYYDYPVILHLARIMIEEEFGIKTSTTVYKEHKYELGRFSKILDQGIISKLKLGATLPRRSIQFKSNLNIRLWNESKFEALENLQPKVIRAFNGKIEVCLSDDRDLMKISMYLDFPNEKLLFDPISHEQRISDDGSVIAAARIASTPSKKFFPMQ